MNKSIYEKSEAVFSEIYPTPPNVKIIELQTLDAEKEPEEMIKIDFAKEADRLMVKKMTGSPAGDLKSRLEFDFLKNIRLSENVFLVSRQDFFLCGYLD